MIKVAELILDSDPAPFWRTLQQLGVEQVVSRLPRARGAVDPPWSYAELFALRQRYVDAGFELAVIEDNLPMDQIRLGLPGRDEELARWTSLIRAMGALEIPVLSYHCMAVLGFQRTSIATPIRGGALASRYDDAIMRTMPLTEAGIVSEERLWAGYEWFLERILPVAEEAGVRLALHPDDPPLSPIRGVARIFTSVEAVERAMSLVSSEHHGVTLCQGNFALMTDDLPAVIRRFGRQGKIFYVHFRDVRGDVTDFVESFHDDGQTDMYACMRAYVEVAYDGVMRSDHVPVLDGEPVVAPAYSNVGRVFALGYQTALRQAAQGAS